MPSSSCPPTPLFPTSGNTTMPLNFPSQLPLRSARCLKSAGLDNPYENLKTPLTPPSAYTDFLRSSVVVKTPTSAKFEIPHTGRLEIPPTSAPPLSANCTCHLTRVTINTKIPSRESSTSSTSSASPATSTSAFSLSSASSTSSEKQYYITPMTPFTPGCMRTPHSAHSGQKRLRIPPSPAFSSPGFGPTSSWCDSPVPIYSTVPRTPIKEEDEDMSESEEEIRDRQRSMPRRLPYDNHLPSIRSAGGNDSHSSGCRHHHLVRKVLVPRHSMAMAKTARMSLQPAPKGKKRRTE